MPPFLFFPFISALYTALSSNCQGLFRYKNIDIGIPIFYCYICATYVIMI